MIFWIDNDVFRYSLFVAVGETPERTLRVLEAHAQLDAEEKESLKFDGDGRTIQFETGAQVMLLRKYKPTPEWHATLAHEAYHSAHMMADRIGLGRADASDEAIAYVIGFIVTEILTRIRVKRRGRGQGRKR